jgi:hypothetical protein
MAKRPGRGAGGIRSHGDHHIPSLKRDPHGAHGPAKPHDMRGRIPQKGPRVIHEEIDEAEYARVVAAFKKHDPLFTTAHSNDLSKIAREAKMSEARLKSLIRTMHINNPQRATVEGEWWTVS